MSSSHLRSLAWVVGTSYFSIINTGHVTCSCRLVLAFQGYHDHSGQIVVAFSEGWSSRLFVTHGLYQPTRALYPYWGFPS